MKKILCIMLLFVSVFLLYGCSQEPEEAIVGQWEYEKGGTYYLILADGTIIEIGINGMDEYIATVLITEEGDYYTGQEWYKVDDEYHWLIPNVTSDEFPNGWDRVVHIDGDTMIIGDDVYEWHKLSKSKELSLKDIYYSTYDEENMAYVSHPLSDLIG